MLSFLYFFYLSSRMSPGTLGGYVWALSFSTLFSIGTDLGLAPVFIREASRRVEDGNKLLRNALALKLPLIVITAVLAFLTIMATGGTDDRTFLVLGAIGVMSLDALSLVLWGALRARQNIFYESISIIIFQIVVFGSGVVFWETTHKIVLVMVALTLGSLANVAIAAGILKFRFGYKLAPAWDKEIIGNFIRTARAFALAGIFVKIYNAADSVILGYMRGEHDVGIYSIPAKVVTALQALIPGAFAASIFPSMSNYFVTSREKLSSVFSKSFCYLLLFAAPIGCGLATIAKPVLASLWPDYIEATPAFVIMGIGLPFVFLAFSTGSLLNA
ncbi:MAG: oligosaccharide flippase family protein, partial [Candidatus Komeilibacteria bacterium]|nr:oligosaccharide flippase family protein [Candidatus Komeilibacteria bacterium]